MTDLERDLRLLRAAIEWPATPDLAASVRAALERAPARPLRWWRRRPALAAAIAVLVAAVAAALAVPQARTAILRALGIGSVRVELVDELPAVSPRSSLQLLGGPVSLEEARASFDFPLLVPDKDVLGHPDEVRLAATPVPQVSYLWLGQRGVRLLASVLPGRFVGSGFVKLIGPGTELENLTVDGRRALWISGAAHGFGLEGAGVAEFEEMRLAKNTLLVDHVQITLRIEGDLTRDQAIRVARAMR